MLIREVASPELDAARLAALSSYIMGRNRDTNSSKPTPIETFIAMAQNMGISLSDQELRDLAQKPPLNGLVKNVTNHEVIFKGDQSDENTTDTMTVDQAKKTVDTMAKRASAKNR